jgi:hypothetical protein
MALVEGIHAILLAIVRTLARWGRVLWVCRVAALSAIGGGLLMVYLPQSLDLFADTGLRWRQWAVFLGLVFCWGWIVHVTARRALQYDDWQWKGRSGRLSPERRRELQQEFGAAALAIPRALGFLVFCFVALGMWTARRNLADATDGLPPAQDASARILVLLIALAVVAIGYALAVLIRRDLEARLTGRPREPALLAGRIPLLTVILQPMKHHARLRWSQLSWLHQALGVAWIVVAAVFVLALVKPHVLGEWLPRILFLPLLIGGSVLLLGEIAALSHRWRIPLLAILVAVSVGLTTWFDRSNDTRWTTPPAAQAGSAAVGATRQISFPEAVQRWRQANQCGDPAPPASCPDPIVIAGAGGASRAAFQTATVVGALLDLNRLDVEHRRYADIRSRLFGFSTVSGSSLAAVVIRAALTDALERGHADTPPCRAFAGAGWWGVTRSGRAALDAEADMPFNPTRSWRDCFQQLMAGDYLSAVMVGLAFRDNFPLGNPLSRRVLWSDRAALLEQAFERRYHRITGLGAAVCSPQVATGLCRRVGYHPDPQRAGAWLPLLFINGSADASGRRILTSDIGVTDGVAPDDAVVRLASDTRDLRGAPPPDGDPASRLPAGSDLMLSTAATLGCRFPGSAAQGPAREQSGAIERENDGLASAADIVRALRRAGLKPIVIHIGNESINHAGTDRRQAGPAASRPSGAEPALFDPCFSVLRGFLAPRSAAADEHAEVVKAALGEPQRFVAIAVRPITSGTGPLCRYPKTAKASIRFMSTSWWVSQPVQAYLDAQLCAEENWEQLVGLLKNTRGPKLAPWMYDGAGGAR